MSGSSNTTVNLYFSREDQAVLREAVRLANKERPEIRFNASMLMRMLLNGYADGKTGPAALPKIKVNRLRIRREVTNALVQKVVKDRVTASKVKKTRKVRKQHPAPSGYTATDPGETQQTVPGLAPSEPAE